MPNENPWAYNEVRDRIREKKEKEVVLAEIKKEDFEKTKTLLRKRNSLDVRELKNHIAVGHSLESLKSEIQSALNEWTISRDTYDKVIASIDAGKDKKIEDIGLIHPDNLPFSQNKLAKYLEDQPLWENIWADIAWFMYGFLIQGSAVLVIIAWKIFTDFLFLPRDIYREYIK
jgi:hypothetical protein